jgi:hypothetical protein
MKLNRLFAITAAIAAVSAITFAADDENHEIIEKVMKEGMKGDDSPYAKAKAGDLSKDDAAAFAKLVGTLKGTKAPVGEQSDFDKKVAALIASADAVAGGDTGEKALGSLKEAGNCKSCHSDHKPKKD